MIVYLARDIPAFVMYCVYGESRSSLLIESTNYMIVLLYGDILSVYHPDSEGLLFSLHLTR